MPGCNETGDGFERIRRREICGSVRIFASEEACGYRLKACDELNAGNLGDDSAVQERVERVPKERRLGGRDNGIRESCRGCGSTNVTGLRISSDQGGNEWKYRLAG